MMPGGFRDTVTRGWARPLREERSHGTKVERSDPSNGKSKGIEYVDYSPVSNIGDIWSLEEGSDEGSIVLDIGEVGLNAFLQQFV